MWQQDSGREAKPTGQGATVQRLSTPPEQGRLHHVRQGHFPGRILSRQMRQVRLFGARRLRVGQSRL